MSTADSEFRLGVHLLAVRLVDVLIATDDISIATSISASLLLARSQLEAHRDEQGGCPPRIQALIDLIGVVLADFGVIPDSLPAPGVVQ